MKKQFLIFFFVVSFIISDSIHQNNHLNLSDSIPRNQSSKEPLTRQKIEEIYDEDEFDTTGVDMDSLDLTNINTRVKNNVNEKPAENIIESHLNKQNLNILKDSNNVVANKTDKLESNIRFYHNNEHPLNGNINDSKEGLRINEMDQYNSDDLKKYEYENGIQSHLGSSIEELDGYSKRNSRRGYNRKGVMGSNEYMGRRASMGDSMGNNGHMGGSNMNNYQNFNNSSKLTI
jgi:hypothetical protein